MATTLAAEEVPRVFAAQGWTNGVWEDGSTDDNELKLSGNEILLFRDSSEVGMTVQLTSVVDEYYRTQDVTITIPAGAGEVMAYGPLPVRGFADGNGNVTIGQESNLEIAIFRLGQI